MVDGDRDGESDLADDITIDHIFHTLSNLRRRWVLQYLFTHGGKAHIREITDHVASVENNTSIENLSSDQRNRTYLELYQLHLKKMDDMNILNFDSDSGDVELTNEGERIKSFFDDIDSSKLFGIKRSSASEASPRTTLLRVGTYAFIVIITINGLFVISLQGAYSRVGVYLMPILAFGLLTVFIYSRVSSRSESVSQSAAIVVPEIGTSTKESDTSTEDTSQDVSDTRGENSDSTERQSG